MCGCLNCCPASCHCRCHLMRSHLCCCLPPKPVEPTGLGAVVEAINGNYFVRTGDAGWAHFEDACGEPCNWGDIAVVRVLSEGVTP